MSVRFHQDIDLFASSISESEELFRRDENFARQKKLTLHDRLNDELDTIYESFYLRAPCLPTSPHSLDRLGLLFRPSSDEFEDDTQNIKFLAQITRIYEFCVRVRCRTCSHLAQSCLCHGFEIMASKKCVDMTRYRVEMNATFQVDDHTSLLKISYAETDFDFKARLDIKYLRNKCRNPGQQFKKEWRKKMMSYWNDFLL